MMSPRLIDKNGTQPTEKEKKVESEKFMAVLLLLNSDPIRYKALNTELLHSAQLKEDDEYPKTSSSAYELMCRRSGRYENILTPRYESSHRRINNGYRRAVQFLQDGNTGPPNNCSLVTGLDNTTIQVQCYKCQDWGHLANNCPSPHSRPRGSGPSGIGLVQIRNTCSFTQGKSMIPKSWILLDTCSTSNCCNNSNLVHDLRKCNDDEELTVHTNGGTKNIL